MTKGLYFPSSSDPESLPKALVRPPAQLRSAATDPVSVPYSDAMAAATNAKDAA